MPSGPGTYGSKQGRPPKKKKKGMLAGKAKAKGPMSNRKKA
jgi:hypothetical protein